MTGPTPRRTAAAIAAVGATAIGVLLLAAVDPVGAIGAQDATTTTTTTIDTAGDGHGARHDRVRLRARRILRAGLAEAAEVLGITPAELRAELRDDRTVAEVAEERGVPLSEVVDALVAAATERIETAVAQGSLTEERAARLTDGLAPRIERGLRTARSDLPVHRDRSDGED